MKTEVEEQKKLGLKVVSVEFTPALDAGRCLAKVYELLLVTKSEDGNEEHCEDE